MSATIWLIVAVVLLLIELGVPMLVFCWFAVGALVVACAALLGLASLSLQLLLFAGTSAVLLLGTRRIVQRYLLRSSPGVSVQTNQDALLGQLGRVVAAIDGSLGAGRVALQGMDWAARSLDGEAIPDGAVVRVVQVQGVTLIVEPDPGL